MTLIEEKYSSERRLTMENRSFYIQEDKLCNSLRLDVDIANSKNPQHSYWEPSLIRNACNEILARMNITDFTSNCSLKKYFSNMQRFKQVNLKQKDKMVIHAPDISRNFILNSAVHDATNIILKPYLTSSVPLSYSPNIQIYAKDCELMDSKQEHTRKSQYFLTQMATIAWDFLNISNIFHCNTKQQEIENDS